MHSYPIDTTDKLANLLLDEVFQCEDILALEEDALLADLRYYEQFMHRHGLPAELRRLYRQHISHIEMLLTGLTDCLVASPCATPAVVH